MEWKERTKRRCGFGGGSPWFFIGHLIDTCGTNMRHDLGRVSRAVGFGGRVSMITEYSAEPEGNGGIVVPNERET